MKIAHLALGGCLKGPPVSYGLTEDTGGHIAYILGAATAQASSAAVTSVTILTRLFEGEDFEPAHATTLEVVSDKLTIRRIATKNRGYLEKEALGDELDAFTGAVLKMMADPARRPDILHAHFSDAADVALAVRERFGIPFVYTPHSLILQKPSPGIAAEGRIAAERRAIETADGIIVSSRDEADRQVAAYRVAGADRRVHCLPPGPPPVEAEDGSTLVSVLRDRLADPDRPMILAVARPVRKKNLVALAEAFAKCRALQAKANLVILAGQPDRRSQGGEEREIVARLDATLSPPELRSCSIRFGHHTHGDVHALYRLAAKTGGAFVNPALHEPFGLTILEAAASGLPVVATRNGGAGEIVDTLGHGLLVDPEDRDAIADACLRLVTDRRLHARLSRAALRYDDHYSWARYGRRSIRLYEAARRVRRQRTSRLLVCDIDGTLTGCAAAAARFAEWAASRGDIGFIVATGRSLDDARRVLGTWKLPEPDAYITDVGTMIHRRGAGGHLECCAVFAQRIERNWDRDAVEGVVVGLGLTPQSADTANRHKLSFFGSASDADGVRRSLREAALAARVVFSHGRYIDVLAPLAGKGAAMAAYAESLGLGVEDCVAAGDSGNDADMLAVCGIGIVVANASDELDGLPPRPGLLRAAASYADGVLEGLEAIGLGRPDERTDPGLAA